MQEQNETNSAEPPEGVDKGWFLFFITLLDQIYWVASAAIFVLSDRTYQN